jgi:hypothetical protein
MGYVLVNLAVWVVADFSVVRVVAVVLEMFVMLDMVVEIVAVRFWGEFSFCCGKQGKKQNFVISLIIVVLLARYM